METEIDLSAELSRKVTDALITIVTKAENGSYSPTQAKACVWTLFEGTMGIIDDDTAELMDGAHKQLENKRLMVRRAFPCVFLRGGVLAMVDIDEQDASLVHVIIKTHAKDADHRKYHLENTHEAKAKANNAARYFTERGWERIL